MGKNYVENSLKRFLKRKVKITLGFVVAFMISGTVGFAEVQNPIGDEISKAEEIILNLGNSMFDENNTEKKINVSYNNNNINIMSESNKELTIDFSKITDINSVITTKSLTFSNDLLTETAAEN